MLTRWLLLSFGILLATLCLAVYVEVYRTMEPFGGIPYSWDLLSLNAGKFFVWVAALLAGLAMIALALLSFWRARRKSDHRI
jgi:hypothetical protein